jgi:ribose transport system substrate-binding protein
MLIGLAAVAVIASACSAGASPTPSATSTAQASAPASAGASAPASAGAGNYHIGVSNTLAGNGWREEMICSIKAQALKSGEVSKITEFHRNTDAAGQLEDLRNLIAADVDAIIVNPAGPDAVNAALKEATDAGITVVAVDQAVTEPSVYLMANNQEEYGYLGAKWLFEQLGGEGNVYYMRGIAGAAADTDRDTGWKRALGEFPNIKEIGQVHTGWDPTTGTQQITEFLGTGQEVDGVWTSGIDNVVVSAFKTAGKEFVPVVGADNAGFVEQLLTETGLTGAAVTNPAAVGGAGVTLALQILNGQAPAEKATLVTPEVHTNTDAAGKAALEELNDPDIDDTWPLTYTLDEWTTYSKEEIIACKGPGEAE